MSTAVVVGNPKASSRTLDAARGVAASLTGGPPDATFDLIRFGSGLLDSSSVRVREAAGQVAASDLVIVASPTYKGSYTGVLKLFLDRIESQAWCNVVAIPLMLGGDWRHSLAPEVFLRPVLVELGASMPTPSLFLLDSEYSSSERLDSWLDIAVRQLPPHLVAASELTRRSPKRDGERS